MIELTQDEYDELMSDSLFLSCLEAAGVDNWDGYEIAQDMYAEQYGDTLH
jgi:hypothetical protein